MTWFTYSTRGSRRSAAGVARRKAKGPSGFRPCLEALEERRLLTAIPVTTFADVTSPYDEVTSLREAIAMAAETDKRKGAHPGDDTIILPHEIGGIEGTYKCPNLTINDATGKVTIESSGGMATIVGNKTGSIFKVGSGSQLALIGLTITGGGGVYGGGAVYNAGTLEITGCTITGNMAGYGGGVYNVGTLEITDSALTGNSASEWGGAVYNVGTLEITNSALTGNHAYSSGGAIYNVGTLEITDSSLTGNDTYYEAGAIMNATFGDGGKATITRSTLNGNKTGSLFFGSPGKGGGIFNSPSSTLAVVDSTVANNSAGEGGGVYNAGKLDITGSTFSGNSAGPAGLSFASQTVDQGPAIDPVALPMSAPAGRLGGGVENVGVLKITDCTFSGNLAADDGGGIDNRGTLDIVGSTFSENSAGYSGGGVANRYGGPITATLTIADTTFSGNSASSSGGGVLNANGMTITIVRSTFSGNSAGHYVYAPSDGGGIWTNGSTLISDSAFIGNTATGGSGGGINQDLSGDLLVAGCTFTGNVALHSGGGISSGGFYSNSVSLTDNTFNGNSVLSGAGGGIFITSPYSGMNLVSGNVIQENIGEGLAVLNQNNVSLAPVTISGNTITANSKSGVLLLETSFEPVPYGGTSLVDNTIAFNGGAGVAVTVGSGSYGYAGNFARNSIRGNSIYGNAGLPIDLGVDGATQNDELDADDGPNHLQNFPVLSLAISDGTSARVSGALHSTPNTSFLIDFYASPPDGQGQSYLGAATVMTDEAGDAKYVVDLPAPIGWTIAATATTVDVPWGETSEFSDAVTVQPPPAVQSVVVNDGSAQRSMVNRLEVTFNQTVTIDPGAFELLSKTGDLVALNVSTSVVAGRTVAVLTFWGTNVVGGSLADGNYTLTVRADKVHDLLGHELDGDGNGLSGGNHVDDFFRLFGDADGDHDVDNLDFDQFKDTRFLHFSDPGFLWYFDFDGDGAISPKDQKQLLNRRAAFLR
jgi:hypothetical protein